MANKYLIEGATYCGDGTASNEAASAGATGAWNNINVFEGTAPAYGTLAAGDVVYIRSKTSAGADITRTVTANISIGSASATFAAPITWVIDSGDVWSGVSGTLTYNITSGNPQITFRGHNTTHASVEDALIFQITAIGGSGPSASDIAAAVVAAMQTSPTPFPSNVTHFNGHATQGSGQPNDPVRPA